METEALTPEQIKNDPDFKQCVRSAEKKNFLAGLVGSLSYVGFSMFRSQKPKPIFCLVAFFPFYLSSTLIQYSNCIFSNPIYQEHQKKMRELERSGGIEGLILEVVSIEGLILEVVSIEGLILEVLIIGTIELTLQEGMEELLTTEKTIVGTESRHRLKRRNQFL
eukprot:TRINITY_DN316_c0_g1_i1.p1 TRINITY_DN316_c0_g1~~TRINITY_DN316_c0_g1_i1.p1  ORF type:complete len:165 (-),score=10.81 TRINITY_DN316_c0_g1_i1:445-939(-)